MGVSVGVGVVPGGAVGVAIARGRDTAWVQADRATVTASATARYPRTTRRYNEHCDLWFRSALAQESGTNLVGELNAASRQPHLAISLQQQASPHQMATLLGEIACRIGASEKSHADHRRLAASTPR